MRRLKAPDGRRWLGRRIDVDAVPGLKTALGLGDLATNLGDASEIERLVLREGLQLALGEGLWLCRARVMDRSRVEVVGGAKVRDALLQIGCFVEIIAYTPRLFVPVGAPAVLDAVLKRWPPQQLLPAAA